MNLKTAHSDKNFELYSERQTVQSPNARESDHAGEDHTSSFTQQCMTKVQSDSVAPFHYILSMVIN